MEYLNRIELAGAVGTVRKNQVFGAWVANFSLATEYAYKKADGGYVVETTWHNVVAWEGEKVKLESIEKGAKLKVVGRLRAQKYTSADGVEKTYYEVVASSVNEVKE